MLPAQRRALDESIVKMRVGRLKRRTFLERIGALGLSASAANALLAACGGTGDSTSGNGSAINITWQSEYDAQGVYQTLVDTFNRTNKDGIYVTYLNGLQDSGQLRANYLDMLNSRSDANDIISLDIIWPAEFATNQWTVPLQDRWPTSERANYLPGPLAGCTFDNQVWAVPLRTDAGLLYYRKDLFPTPPQTWEELTAKARQTRSQGSTRFGYVWQGAQYEGLVCDFMEVVYGYGGSVLDSRNSQKITVDTPEALAALSIMASWINDISPLEVTTYKEDDANAAWMNGDAAFMRNWPYAYTLSNNASRSNVAGKFDIAPLPHGGKEIVGHSIIGGWQLGINAFSNADKVDAAWKFIHYMIGPAAQKTLALEASLAVTLKSVYQDQDVLDKNPIFKNLGAILPNALPRPVSPQYADVSNA